ncbi:MAG: metallopeptidase TldD-related protein [Chloroflexota bacterium]
MIHKITTALKARKELAGWSLRHTVTRDAQVYLIGKQMEAQRIAGQEQFRIEVFRQNESGMGSGEITILAGDDISAALDKATLVAGMVSNPVHTLPVPGALPDVPLLDPEVKRDSLGALDRLMQDMLAAGASLEDVRLTSGEGFAQVTQIRHVNSNGIDAEQEMSNVNAEFVLQSKRGEREVESFRVFGRRRIIDMRIRDEVAENARFTRDLLRAGPPPTWDGPVVLRGQVLADFAAGEKLVASVLQSLGSGGTKYAKISNWEVGKSVFKGDVAGDPLTVWANRAIPYGVASDRFDGEGLPAQRVELIRDNNLVNFAASQRYADYLSIPPTGAFGSVELAPGKWESAALMEEPHVEIALFSWFNPNFVTGDFACEIRLGYVVENGVRKPFRGGQLVGNVLDALANVKWSKESALLGHYLGPTTARFGKLKVAGE